VGYRHMEGPRRRRTGWWLPYSPHAPREIGASRDLGQRLHPLPRQGPYIVKHVKKRYERRVLLILLSFERLKWCVWGEATADAMKTVKPTLIQRSTLMAEKKEG
jgi:hypothetical protein